MLKLILNSDYSIAVLDPENFQELSFEAANAWDVREIDSALQQSNWGKALGESHVGISESKLLSALTEAFINTDNSWKSNYQKMLNYAEKKGWLLENGALIRVHVSRN